MDAISFKDFLTLRKIKCPQPLLLAEEMLGGGKNIFRKHFPCEKHVTWRYELTLFGFIRLKLAGKCHNAASIRWNMENLGRDPFNQNFRKFRSTTEWIGSVQKEKFRKIGSTFGGGPLFSVGPVRSKLTVLFELIFNPNASLFVTFHRCFSYMCSNNNYKAVLPSVCFGC